MQPSERTLRFNEVRWCLSSIKGDSLIGACRLAFYSFENWKVVQVFTIVDIGDIADSLASKT